MKVLNNNKKMFIGNSAEFENDARLNSLEEISEVGQNGKTEETV